MTDAGKLDLALSVRDATPGIRLLIAIVFTAAALLLLGGAAELLRVGGAVSIAVAGGATLVAVTALLAAIFVFWPVSKFGQWLAGSRGSAAVVLLTFALAGTVLVMIATVR